MCRFGNGRRASSDVDEGEGPLMEELAYSGRSMAESDVEAATPTTPRASLSQQRVSTLSPRGSSALNGNSKFSPYV